MRKYKQRINNLVIILLLLLGGLGIGYSLINQTLTITGVSKFLSTNWNIHFTNVQKMNGSINASSPATIDSTETNVSYSVHFKKPGEYYEFTVDVVNEGNLKGMVGIVSSKLNGTEITTLPSYLEYRVTYFDLLEIQPKQILRVGDTETFRIRIGIKENIDISELPDTAISLNLDFSVTYVQADDTAIEIGNAVLCNYDGDLVQGAEYVYGDYTYRYKQRVEGVEDQSGNWPSQWINIDDDGWGVRLTDLNSTSPVTSELCTRINNKPIIAMSRAFYESKTTSIDSSSYNTRYVKYMSSMFESSLVTSFDFSKLNTSSATQMSYMFKNSVFPSLDLRSWETSKVETMESMFADNGVINSIQLNFDTSNVEKMNLMFFKTGYDSTIFTLDLGDKFDTSNVTNMHQLFYNTGYSSTVFTLDLGDKFDTSNITNMNQMFYYTGYSSTAFTLDLGDKFDTSQVTEMEYMFQETGHSSTVFTLDLGDKFDTSNVTTMLNMFTATGHNNPNFTIDFGDKFFTTNVTDMGNMFFDTALASNNLVLDLSTFSFSSVTNSHNMFHGIKTSTKVYVKDATARSWVIAKESNLTTSNVLIK